MDASNGKEHERRLNKAGNLHVSPKNDLRIRTLLKLSYFLHPISTFKFTFIEEIVVYIFLHIYNLSIYLLFTRDISTFSFSRKKLTTRIKSIKNFLIERFLMKATQAMKACVKSRHADCTRLDIPV